MKEHESRVLKDGEWYFFYEVKRGIKNRGVLIIGDVFIDSNNFLHNLNGEAWNSVNISHYYIHGRYFKYKRDWEIEANRIKMLNEIS